MKYMFLGGENIAIQVAKTIPNFGSARQIGFANAEYSGDRYEVFEIFTDTSVERVAIAI